MDFESCPFSFPDEPAFEAKIWSLRELISSEEKPLSSWEESEDESSRLINNTEHLWMCKIPLDRL